MLPVGVVGKSPGAPSVEFPAPNEPEAPPFDPQGNAPSNGFPLAGTPRRPDPGYPEAPGGDSPRKLGPAAGAFPVEPFGPPGELPGLVPLTIGEESRVPGKAGAAHESGQVKPVGWDEPLDGSAAPAFASPFRRGDPGDNGSSQGAGSPVAPASDAFANAWRTGLRQIEQDQLRDALYTLSAWLGSPDLTPEQADQLQQLLDQLAGTVIFSDEHLMEPAYVVRRGEQLQDIAAFYHVPWELLAKINGLEEPYVLLPAQQLKVVKGPFAARVDLQQQQVFLYLRGYYAGRFVFTAGRDQPPRPGTYQVISKMEQRTWYDESGHEVPPDHPDQPFGPFWIDLGSNQSIHGAAASGPDRGCVSVGPRDAEDLYGILAVGSQVIIR